MANRFANAELLKTQTIGVEIEMSKISKSNACQIVADYFNSICDGLDSVVTHPGNHHDNYACKGKPAKDGSTRIWQFMDDGSTGGDWGHITCEMVTPILTYDDIGDLQNIVRLLRGAGAKSGAHYNAGVHIHIGADFDALGGQNAKTIRNLVNLIASHERIIAYAVGVTPSRRGWCHWVDDSFLHNINTQKPKTKEQLGILWYGSRNEYNYVINNRRSCHYHDSRYHLLNLHAIWDKGTIEFRCFEFHNNLHAGELKAWIQLCLAMCSYAKVVRNCGYEQIDFSNQKYAVKNWLNNMGLKGDEFKTCRLHLTKNLKGDCAYRNGRMVDDLDDSAFDIGAPAYDLDGIEI